MNLEFPIDVYGWEQNVFSYTVNKTFLTLKQISQFEPYHGDYQRDKDDSHINNIVDFLENGLDKRYFPDIVVAIRHRDLNMTAENRVYLNDANFYLYKYKNHDGSRIVIKSQEAIQHIKIIDGNHRVSAIKKLLEQKPNSEIGDFSIGVTFLFMTDNNIDFEKEMALFYYLNAKAKPLLPVDYLSDALDKLDDNQAKDIDWWLYVFKESYRALSSTLSEKISIENQKKMLANSCDYLAYQIKKSEFRILPDILIRIEEILKKPDLNETIDNFIKRDNLFVLLNILFFLVYKYTKIQAWSDEIAKQIAKEITNFYDWLVNIAKVNNFDDFENLYKTYKETYIPKSNKIFLSMPFHRETDIVYLAVQNVVSELEKRLQIKIDLKRIDHHIEGESYPIPDEVFNQIENCDLMIADLTGNNPNVYNEIGYKMALDKIDGLEKPRIMFLFNKTSTYNIKPTEATGAVKTYHIEEREINDVRFNLFAYRQIRFEQSSELITKLSLELQKYFENF